MSTARFPIRIKILVTVLAVLLVVVAVITVVMAELLRRDKAVYVRDYAAQKAHQVGAEVDALVAAQARSLQVVTGLLLDAERRGEDKERALEAVFAGFPDLVAVTLHRPAQEPVSVYDLSSLRAAGLGEAALAAIHARRGWPALAPGRLAVQNATSAADLPLAAIAAAVSDGVIVEALVRLDHLMTLLRDAQADVVIVEPTGVVLAHRDAQRVAARARAAWLLDLPELADNPQADSGAAQLTHDGRGFFAGYARSPATGLLTGVLIPNEAAYGTGRALVRDLLGVSIGLFLAAALLSLLIAGRLTRPIERLGAATQAIGRGHFDVEVDAHSRDEIGLLSASFNTMALELKSREQELERTHRALVQSEKMAAFGQLGAGIAHEVKNPLAGIRGHAQLAMRRLAPDDPVRSKLEIIEKETARCTEIIGNLLKFARQEPVERIPTDLNQVAGDALAIVDHQLSLHKVRIETALAAGLPRVLGNANQLQQVLLNLAINAQQAMGEQGGTLRVETSVQGGRVHLVVSDTGPGIPPEIQRRIFEPFFTSKPAGQGTGLGLSVTYGIIKDHDGEIRVESEPGHGATFHISLPVHAQSAAA